MPSLIKRNNVSMDSIIVHSAKYKIVAATDKYKSQNYPNLGIGARSISNRSKIYKSTVCCSAVYLPPATPNGIVLITSDSTNMTIEITGKTYKVVSFYITYTPTAGGTTKYATFTNSTGTLTDLTPNTNYTISVVAINPSGSSDSYTGTNSYYTTIAPPTNITIVGYTDNTVTISYTAPSGTVTKYIIYYTPSDGTISSYDNGTNTTATISGLSPNTTYTVYVTAFNSNGESSGSDTVTFTTDELDVFTPTTFSSLLDTEVYL
uniref:Fibronectin type-III domain-containing protein n=1 Tax=viral metagenome TaxID=1070528 RepID=A0A6C0HB25_9ZZZZ